MGSCQTLATPTRNDIALFLLSSLKSSTLINHLEDLKQPALNALVLLLCESRLPVARALAMFVSLCDRLHAGTAEGSFLKRCRAFASSGEVVVP